MDSKFPEQLEIDFGNWDNHRNIVRPLIERQDKQNIEDSVRAISIVVTNSTEEDCGIKTNTV